MAWRPTAHGLLSSLGLSGGENRTRAPLLRPGHPLSPTQAGVPRVDYQVEKPVLLSLIRQESLFSTRARSRAGARGLMQIMPATARFLEGNGFALEKLFQPEFNLQLGQNYLLFLQKEAYIGDNMAFLLAAYNWGPGNLRRWMKKNDDVSDQLLFMETLPVEETRDYLRNIFRNHLIYKEREKNERAAYVASLVLDAASEKAERGKLQAAHTGRSRNDRLDRGPATERRADSHVWQPLWTVSNRDGSFSLGRTGPEQVQKTRLEPPPNPFTGKASDAEREAKKCRIPAARLRHFDGLGQPHEGDGPLGGLSGDRSGGSRPQSARAHFMPRLRGNHRTPSEKLDPESRHPGHRDNRRHRHHRTRRDPRGPRARSRKSHPGIRRTVSFSLL